MLFQASAEKSDPVAGGVLNLVERQRDQIGHVGEQVQTDDNERTERERQRDVAPRILHLAGGERDVVPRVGGEQRADLRYGDGDHQAKDR